MDLNETKLEYYATWFTWHPFDYSKKAKSLVPRGTFLVVYEEFYHDGITLAIFDGLTFRILPSGSDDCSILSWAVLDLDQLQGLDTRIAEPQKPTSEGEKSD